MPLPLAPPDTLTQLVGLILPLPAAFGVVFLAFLLYVCLCFLAGSFLKR